ncbi:hypothetical protein AGRA3207_002277 [Actinomadura graeca]|uniref:Uncharacterized protein n=1 Tax=Actinomadura graeca TaxID=2750812 RepID=A0ABX8QRL3_9ACTN|nr:hypothetical protein [Actinomadura graeca]QXJ21425.1 hypothetical protein AGRA3207_002277 [Actinomadura graeca]
MTVRHDGTGPLRSAEELVFYGITGRGTLQAQELFRFMERTGPQWWLPVSGTTREEFWTSTGHVLMARHTVVRVLEGGCRPSDAVTVEHAISHGRRPRPGRDPEFGFVDRLAVRRDADGLVIADLTSDTVWVDVRDGSPKVAAAPPGGLDCPFEELPPIEPYPEAGEPVATGSFRWTARETDVTNRHVSFPSYAERAENALADAGIPVPDRHVWEGWYRLGFAAGEATTATVGRAGAAFVVGFAPQDRTRPRVHVRMSGPGS